MAEEDKILDATLCRLWDQFDEAAQSRDPSERQVGLDNAINALESLALKGSDARIWYALGYAWYIHSERRHSSEIGHSVLACLGKALQEDPEFHLAHLYICHHFYDLGNYQAAMTSVDRVDPVHLDEYMRIKWAEMRVCCYLRVLGVAGTLEALNAFLSLARGYDRNDIVPLNLETTLKELRSELDQAARAALREHLVDLDQLGGHQEWLAGVVSDDGP